METSDEKTPPTDSGKPKTPGKWRRRLKFSAIVAVVLSVMAVAMLGTAEYYTARPEFCGSCHIMDPYYRSWEKDAHGVEQIASCVDCHYAPGEHHTLMAKFRGLSQLASYFSGRAGAGRPKPRVNDASCMKSGCHEDRKFMSTQLKLGTVTFTHANHLDPESGILVARKKQLANLRAKLQKRLETGQMKVVESISSSVQHSHARNVALAEWLQAQGQSELHDDVLAYGQLLHTEVRIKQLGGLRCSSCHQFDTSLEEHFAVDTTTCYTCHFMNEPFNANTGRCLACHEPPSGNILAHSSGRVRSKTRPAEPEREATMDHATIVANNVNCVSCHADLIQGTGEVTLRNCQNCHDQARYWKDYARLTTDVISEYHHVHASGQRARCNDCHQMINHILSPVAVADDVITLLTPVRQNCQHCHPDHHREQVEMLLGRGGFVASELPAPDPMISSRANCQACHIKPGRDPKGEMVITGTLASCSGCHGKDYEQLFERWQRTIQARLQEAQKLVENVQQKLTTASQPHNRDVTKATELFERSKKNVSLVASANGIHNKNYAMMLLDQVVIDMENALTLLSR